VIYTGAYDVAATAVHWPVTHWVMETARIRSIRAKGVVAASQARKPGPASAEAVRTDKSGSR
jgi:hypothetical protein